MKFCMIAWISKKKNKRKENITDITLLSHYSISSVIDY